MLALQLAFYLTSWGMYRGSSLLLQKDFTVHLPVVKALLSEEFTSLWNLPMDGVSERSVELIFS